MAGTSPAMTTCSSSALVQRIRRRP
ncbi:hypothetical protein HMPREF9696_01799, partial [Afipia clevelandensis ATCC 49720]